MSNAYEKIKELQMKSQMERLNDLGSTTIVNEDAKLLEDQISNEILVSAPVTPSETYTVIKTAPKKVGRPKKWKVEKEYLSIGVSSELKKMIDIAAKCYGGSITGYINTIIRNDLNNNFEKYKANSSEMLMCPVSEYHE